jgi:hypothetical protein
MPEISAMVETCRPAIVANNAQFPTIASHKGTRPVHHHIISIPASEAMTRRRNFPMHRFCHASRAKSDAFHGSPSYRSSS